MSFWVPSPELRPRSPSPTSDTGKKSKRSRRSARYSDDSDDDSASEDDKSRRRRSKKSSHKKKKSSKHKKSSSSSRRKHRRSPTPSDESASEDGSQSDKATPNGKDGVLEVDETQLDAVPDLWVEKQGTYLTPIQRKIEIHTKPNPVYTYQLRWWTIPRQLDLYL